MKSPQMLHIACVLAVVSLLLLPQAGLGAEQDEAPVPIRIGWQMPALTQAAIVQVLKRTDVLARHGLDPSLVPFSYGTPQIEAAFAGELDAFFAGDQPAINLLARGGKWKIVGRAFYDRIALIVPPNSPIETVADLKGGTVASPFGSVGYREALLAQDAAGLDTEQDVENVNVDILEIRRLVLEGGVDSWEGIDAAAVWEPNLSSFKLDGLTRNLTETRTLGVIAISDEFMARHPEASVQFLVALIRAWHFFARDPQRVLRWYNDDTQLEYDLRALLAAVRIDPNISATSLRGVDITLTEEHLAILTRNAAWGVHTWKKDSRILDFVDHGLLKQAMQEVATTEFADLRVILPSIRAVESMKTVKHYGLDKVPLGVLFSFMVLAVLLAIELGLWLGRRSREEITHEAARPVGTAGAAVLGMMAFVIALTFGSATTRFDARKMALLDDVTAINTAYLRADTLPEPHRTTMRSLLRDYVQARVGMVYAYGDPETLRVVERHAKTLQSLMWSHVRAMAKDEGRSGHHETISGALNDVFNLHIRRVVLGAYYRIPGFLWWAIIFASAVGMVAVGFQFGICGGRRVLTANLALALTFALVMMLAFDLDRAGEGLISVNQRPMIELYQSMSGYR